MKEVLVIRKFDDFSHTLAENNFRVINLPLVETSSLDDLRQFEKQFDTLHEYNGIFITSSVAAQVFAEKLSKKKTEFKGKIYVLGRKSFEILRKLNLDLFYTTEANTACELLKAIPPENLINKKFLFVRGEKSLNVVPDFLAKFGRTDQAIVYRNKEIAAEPDKIKKIVEKIKEGEIQSICFFSPSAAKGFIKQFGAEFLHQTVIAVIGKTTAEFFERQNFAVGFVSSKANAKDFALGLVKFLEKRNS